MVKRTKIKINKCYLKLYDNVRTLSMKHCGQNFRNSISHKHEIFELKNQNREETYAVSAIEYFRKTHPFLSVWIETLLLWIFESNG